MSREELRVVLDETHPKFDKLFESLDRNGDSSIDREEAHAFFAMAFANAFPPSTQGFANVNKDEM